MPTPRLPPAASLLIALLLLLTLPAAAYPDGKVFARATAAPTPIPDQQAIIVYDAKSQTQTLAIETRFIPPTPAPAAGSTLPTDAAPFAWVVPLPGPDVPTIRAATTGLFPTVREVFQPRVEHSGGQTAGICVFLIALILIGLLATLIKSNVFQSVVFCVLVFFFLALILLPALGKARARAGGPDSLVTTLDRTTVGSYDITVIGAAASSANTDPLAAGKDLAAWLKGNGFQMPTGVEPVLEHYAARKWVFAACKLREMPGASGPLAPHPLIFTFKTPQCVYPLELTGVGNGPLSVDLYVFSNQRAAAANFEEVRCQMLESEDFAAGMQYPHFAPYGRVTLAHPLLGELAKGTTVATKLSATLTPAQQQNDASINWLSPQESGGVKYSKQGASGYALDVAAATVLVGLIVLIFIAAIRKQNAAWVFRKMAWPLVVAFVVGGALYAAVPKIEIVEGGWRSSRRVASEHSATPYQVRKQLAAMSSKQDIEMIRQLVRKEWEGLSKGRVRFTPPREEDSPLNYLIRPGQDPDSVEYVWFDFAGAPHAETIWPLDPNERFR